MQQINFEDNYHLDSLNESIGYLFIKRLIDIVASLIGLVLLSPLLLIEVIFISLLVASEIISIK